MLETESSHIGSNFHWTAYWTTYWWQRTQQKGETFMWGLQDLQLGMNDGEFTGPSGVAASKGHFTAGIPISQEVESAGQKN